MKRLRLCEINNVFGGIPIACLVHMLSKFSGFLKRGRILNLYPLQNKLRRHQGSRAGPETFQGKVKVARTSQSACVSASRHLCTPAAKYYSLVLVNYP